VEAFGPDVHTQLGRAGAFGAIILDGLVAHEIQLGGRVGVSLLGPGDLIVGRHGPDPLILSGSRWRPASPVRLALFRHQMLAAMQKWPELLVGMYVRVGQQLDRLAAQLMLCQLPRVEDRVLGLMWLMAESWGRVTGAGTRLTLDLTHELIGMMIGARRPTVTLALGELADRGAMIRQEDSWLLLERPAGSGEPNAEPRQAEPVLRSVASSLTWTEPSSPGATESDPLRIRASDIRDSYAALEPVLAHLREQHLRTAATFDQRLAAVRAARERCQQTRFELARDRKARIMLVPSGGFHHDDRAGDPIDARRA
jgi:hypothetical protein